MTTGPGSFSFSLNGEPVEVAGLDMHTTLLAWLRARGLTGCKEGCAEGECGACTVVILGPGLSDRPRYQAVTSCLVLVPEVAGREVWTVEALAQGGVLHPVQRVLVEQGGSQCGACTPGLVMSLFAEYYRPGRDGFDLEALGGNLCRCTGYRPIRDAARKLGPPEAGDPFMARLEGPMPEAPEIPRLAYARFWKPRQLSELLRLVAGEPDAELIAGGTDLVVEMNLKQRRFSGLIAVGGVEELHRFVRTRDYVDLGAGLTLSDIQECLGGELPIVAELGRVFASRLIRGRATLGGNLCTASPIGDCAPVLLALDATVQITGPAGERWVHLDQFFTGYRKTALGPGEILATIRIPRPFPPLARFYKVSKRELDDIAIVSAAFARRQDGRVRMAYGGVAATPMRAISAEAACAARPWDTDTMAQVQTILRGSFQPISDHRGSAAYRRAMVEGLFVRFCSESTT